MKIKDGYMIKKVLNDYVVVPVGEEVLNFDGMVKLNNTAAFLWQKLEQETTEQELAIALLEKYEVSAEKAQASVTKVLDKLQEAGFLA